MTIRIDGKTYKTDEDLKVRAIGAVPRVGIRNRELKKYFRENYGRTYLSGDEILAYAQGLVSRNLRDLEAEILKDISGNESLQEIIQRKIGTSIGRGHALRLATLEFVINGSKMIDSGFTGLCTSGTIITSGRRKKASIDDIVIPEGLRGKNQLIREYLEITRDAIREIDRFKAELGNSDAVEALNKFLPYNGSADMIWMVPIDGLFAIASEVERDAKRSEKLLPRELYTFVNMLEVLTDREGVGALYRNRMCVPRITSAHYTVFTDPSESRFAVEFGESLRPKIIDLKVKFSMGLEAVLDNLRDLRENALRENDPARLCAAAMNYTRAMQEFVDSYNDAVRVQISDSLSWRVWGEQKRHATLHQDVESIYSAADIASKRIKEMWESIDRVHTFNQRFSKSDLERIEEVVVIDHRVKNRPELMNAYVYHTAKQLMLYEKIKQEASRRDALFIVPRNVRVSTVETYDLANLIGLELPLRACKTCEPERYATTWAKIKLLKEALPGFADFFVPKCSVGLCTEGKHCGHIESLRSGYDEAFHAEVSRVRLKPAEQYSFGREED